ncbi:FG-GAP repeat domain-containing protein [Xenorhabdus littoralis]|uniref:FG-GAP repeat domain-containing protein n=1 Tax=Xenorhabdus littoralis TaxID=2582835 RepID=UPI0029E7F92A|nr:VCBS repeat-containing protein [Xenorhabdus sp. psl]MDX7992652.1 VCBS repeat-containing protein [Xenorhabdus sp. psl]
MCDKSKSISEPKFKKEIVAEHLRDGYWLEAADIDNDGNMDLFGYGLTLGELYWYQYPNWDKKLIIDKIRMPVGADYADISGNGFPDIIVCYELYGPIGTIYDPDTSGGKIDWIENPGKNVVNSGRWKRHYIGRTTGMHRLRVGYFTQKEKLEILGFPIVAHEDVHAVLPVVLFTQPDNVVESQEWPMTVIDDSNFRMIHGAEKKSKLIPDSDRDSVILASDEGITWIYYDDQEEKWKKVLIGIGEITQFEKTGFKGSGDMDVGKTANDNFSYVAAIEPFHGNTVAVYYKDSNFSPQLAHWKRVLLDVYGDPNENGEGPGHQVICADFDGDGDDEFIVGLRGPWPWQGVFYYKAVDLKRGIFTKWRVSDESVARIALADFKKRGKLDFATIAYSVPNYYVAKEAKIVTHYNEIESNKDV